MNIKKRLTHLVFLSALVVSAVNVYANTNSERIISTGAGLTELFFALDAQQSLVAIDMTSRDYAQKTGLPLVGYHRQLSSEGLMSLAPSILIGTDEMGPESTLNMLKASNVEVITVPTGNTIELLEQRIDTVASLTGKQVQAVALKKSLHQDIEQLENSPLSTQPKVLFLMLNKDRAPTVGGENTSINEVIRLSGALNPAAELIESYKPISFEGIIKMNPDYILVSQRAWDSFGGKQQILAKLPLLAATPAGMEGQIIAVPSSAIIGFGLQSIELAKQLNHSFLNTQG
ncbi:hemin ABC transporter substrate-binding protein [Psychromonas marina]|uniref:Hemin ABC transporter substrate-binding protein n=1 Tax=Psychromonas marina TaxID=88364 RepID=A0ABQ6E104_9GAMM|nr:ABC transporter substrate-binding protein [Psychromonas marina]GLS91068.1 hemin ABC transporter substrate-binding protein [Psychromonas marina]